jgi:hypothetical protein
MWRRNAVVLVASAAAIVAITFFAQANKHVYSNLDSEQRIAVALFALACIAVTSFVNLRGGFWTRTGLVVLVPVLLSFVAEVFNRDAAYPGIGFVLAAVVGIVSFLACVFIGGPIFLWRHRKHGAT